jgi:integrase
LRALYSFLIKRGHAGLNPFASVEFAKKVGVRVIGKIISPEAVRKLLQYALDNNNDYKAECASMVLVFFCGVRVDEVDRLDWKQIRLDGAKSIVDIQEAKNGRRRINPIPVNAVEWLRLCQAKGKVAPPNYTKRMQRLRKKAKVNYPQNSARHCFASYHIAYHRDGAQTGFLLGHPNPKLLYDTYRELVSFEEAEKFWNVVPESSRQEQAELERQRDELAKEEAEMQSNIGLAEKSETGHWIPVMDEDASYSPDMEEVLANL